MRIGHGYDVHKLVEGRPLFLGGVRIEYKYGLDGHSDADAPLHAVCDALLGAAGEKDIGRHFPDTSEEYKDIDSTLLLRKVGGILRRGGFRVINIDITVIAQQPKISPYTDKMEENIASALQIKKECVNVKATTEEGLGFTGREEGISAHAVCLIDGMDI